MWPFKKKEAVPKQAARPLSETARHAGFFAAHAVWCVSEGEILIPMLVHPGTDGKASMTRLVSDDAQKAVAEAKRRLSEDAAQHGAAIVLYDTFVTLGSWRTDAILIEALAGSLELIMAVPYRNAKSDQGFAVYKPKFIKCPAEAVQEIAQTFFDGVDSHEKGNAVWTKFIDQSR
jgi:hypothetical protein